MIDYLRRRAHLIDYPDTTCTSNDMDNGLVAYESVQAFDRTTTTKANPYADQTCCRSCCSSWPSLL